MPIDLTGRLNPNGTFTLSVPDGGANPFAGGQTAAPAATAMVPASGQGFPARLPTGQMVYFTSYQDLIAADALFRQMTSSAPAAIPTLGGASGGGTAGMIRTGAETVETVASFLRGRALNQTLQDYQDNLDELDSAQIELSAPALMTKYGDLLQPLLRALRAERDATATAQQVVEDELTAVDLMAGAGAAKVIAQFTSGGGGSGGMGTALAIGAAGLAGGLLLSNGSTTRRRRPGR